MAAPAAVGRSGGGRCRRRRGGRWAEGDSREVKEAPLLESGGADAVGVAAAENEGALTCGGEWWWWRLGGEGVGG